MESQPVPLQAVVFDYGHTLLDFELVEDSLLECYRDVRHLLLEGAESDVPNAEDLVEYVSRAVDRLVQESYERGALEEVDLVATVQGLLRDRHLHIDATLAEEIVRREHRAMASALAISSENLQVLRDLRHMGLKIGLVSNAHFHSEMMREDLTRLGIAPLVDEAVYSSEIGVRKPHPKIFMHVLDRLRVEPTRTVFVGDRVRDDIAGAKSLGMRGVLTHEFRQEDPSGQPVRPDAVILRLPDVLRFVGSLQEAAAKSRPSPAGQPTGQSE